MGVSARRTLKNIQSLPISLHCRTSASQPHIHIVGLKSSGRLLKKADKYRNNAYKKAQSQTTQEWVSISSFSVLIFQLSSGFVKNICGAQFATMLGCWAATNDLHATGPCTEAAQDLYNCMRTTVSLLCIALIAIRKLIVRAGNTRKAAKV